MIMGGLIVGQGTVSNVILVPGNNSVPIKAVVDIKTIFKNLPTVLASQSSALKSGNIEISASGNSTVYNGQHITYFENVLNKLQLSTQVPLIQILLDTLTSLSSNNDVLSGLLGGLNGTSILNNLSGGSQGNATSLIAGLTGLSSLLVDMKKKRDLESLPPLLEIGS